jgi:energy-coupling factor transporter ATP-binding protein EcfA2
MILRNIEIEGWACFADAVKVGPFDDRLNLLCAPNGKGKSTLLEVMTRGLIDTHTVGGLEAQSLRPWGRTLTPKIQIEFAHGSVEYRLRKRFLDKPSALLEVRDGLRWTSVAEGDAADRQIRELLRAEAPGAGLSSAKHCGIMQVLWSPQDTSASSALSGDVLADIHAALGVEITGPEGIKLQKRVENLYLQFYTPTGRLRSGSGEPLVTRLNRERTEAEKRFECARLNLTKVEAGRERVALLRSHHEDLSQSAERLTAELKQARLHLAEYENLVSQKDAREPRKRAAEAQYARIKQQLDAIQDCRETIIQAEKDLTAIDIDLPLASDLVAIGEQAQKTAAANLQNALANQSKVWEFAARAKVARRFVELQNTLASLSQQLRNVELASLEIERCESAVRAVHAPTQEQLVKMRAAFKTRDDARIRLESSLIGLELSPIADSAIRIISGDLTGEQTVPAGGSARISGSPTVEVEIVGFGRIRATGPPGSAAEYRQRFERATAQVNELTQSFGTTDLAHLEEVWGNAAGLKRNLQSAQDQLGAYLLGKSIESIQVERKQAELEFQSIIYQQPTWIAEPPDVNVIEDAGQQLQQNSEVELREAQDAANLAQQSVHEAKLQQSALLSRHAQRRSQVEDSNRQLEALNSDGKSTELRYQERDQAALDYDAQKAAIQKLDQELALYITSPVKIVAALEPQVTEATQARDLARDRLRDEEARVRQLSSEAPYGALTEADEKLQVILGKLHDEELRTEAVALLRSTIEESRLEAISSIPDRVAETATSILHRIAGTGFRTICLSENLAPTGVSPTSAAGVVSLAELSGGEKEQIAFAVRLALAKELARSERQLLVLDDSLSATDPIRFRRILEILQESAEELQILILTCDSLRYEALSDLKLHDLEGAAKERAIEEAA